MPVKRLKCLLLILIFAGVAAPAFAQNIPSPARWNWTCKKLAENKYELVFHLELKKGYHIFADDDTHGIKRKKGNTIMVPSFKFDNTGEFELEGTVSSKGILETKKMKHLGLVNLYTYKVLYVQNLKTKPGTRVSGSFTYQICTDEEAMEPITERFGMVIK